MAQRIIHLSLVRPQLLGGVPRKFAVVNAAMTAMLINLTYSLGMPLILVACVALGVVTHKLLARAVKKDPKCLDAYIRHVGYQKYYPGRAHPDAPTVPFKTFKIGSGS